MNIIKRRTADIEYEQMLLSRYFVAQHRGGNGLDRSAYLLLSQIDARGPMTIAELSAALRLDVSTLQRQVTAVVRDGLLERSMDPSGSAARKLIMTSHGRALLETVRKGYIRDLDAITSDWSVEDVNTFAELLRRYNGAIEHFRDAKNLS
ncbi:MarR family winged helix-turn-helix transcriptional regulator [Glutamicibacter protophormiae]|uniref:MarR family winged helix-turn-helix transcriptional regulator n=1 Tax=Glutamicibacter protophormiae TaxID=37930 RepID=UPI001EF5CCCB|nr:MarR family transcriptional regulator [Glutamicibacter protophormiae]